MWYLQCPGILRDRTAAAAVALLGGLASTLVRLVEVRRRVWTREPAPQGWDDAARVGSPPDLTERSVHDEPALADQADRIREDERRKHEFLAMLAHELRNPLAAIGNAAYLANESRRPEHVAWAMEVVTRQVAHLSHLIDDLLDASRITRGAIDLRRAVTDLAPILDGAASAVRPLFDQRRQTLEIAVSRTGLPVEIDSTRIEQVISNLLHNAARYSHEGGHVRLAAHAEAESDSVVISVRDSGLGIAPNLMPRLFDLFAQGDRSLARTEGGLGIGLAVVKKLVEMHGGTVHAYSDGPGRGSKFVVRLPRAAPSSPPQTSPEPQPKSPCALACDDGPAARPTPARVLVIDDNLDMARGLAQLLELLGHDPVIAHTGPEGLALARTIRPHVVLLDIGLPGLDGYEIARRLRREPLTRETLLVAVTGYGQESDRRRAADAGFDHHLAKPIDHDALRALLASSRRPQAPAIRPDL
jgi:signal transduction histidine kinase/CheY-like chemotaxis protein